MPVRIHQEDTADDGSTGETSDDGEGGEPSVEATLAGPESLFDREDVEFRETTYVHDDRDHCESEVDGRAVVGVTNGEGEVLLLEHRSGEHAILPNEVVEPGEDWAAVGRRAVEEATGVTVRIDDTVRVREVEHVVDGEPGPHATTHHVVFSASVAGSPDDAAGIVASEARWDAGWFDEVPVDAGQDDVLDDVRLFVE